MPALRFEPVYYCRSPCRKRIGYHLYDAVPYAALYYPFALLYNAYRIGLAGFGVVSHAQLEIGVRRYEAYHLVEARKLNGAEDITRVPPVPENGFRGNLYLLTVYDDMGRRFGLRNFYAFRFHYPYTAGFYFVGDPSSVYPPCVYLQVYRLFFLARFQLLEEIYLRGPAGIGLYLNVGPGRYTFHIVN